MRIYIAGPIVGRPQRNKQLFEEAAQTLMSEGHTPLLPHCEDLEDIRLHVRLNDLVVPPDQAFLNTRHTWSDRMRLNLRLLTIADAVAVLPGWEQGKDARFAASVAESLRMNVAPLSSYVEDK